PSCNSFCSAALVVDVLSQLAHPVNSSIADVPKASAVTRACLSMVLKLSFSHREKSEDREEMTVLGPLYWLGLFLPKLVKVVPATTNPASRSKTGVELVIPETPSTEAPLILKGFPELSPSAKVSTSPVFNLSFTDPLVDALAPSPDPPELPGAAALAAPPPDPAAEPPLPWP